ncbi:protein export cytoplasm protein SecA ATPase RNA helicase [Klebsiella pneumoniae]|uniref:Protein export cytoplasm protein SecA ATPase RNA helicase n=1 Tax=Klebsiella pneumoniae TaxID=573 RepID=A0A377ZKJ7_KLEPN|nr:protein export cytoplasm protein SecA ATPase RNA helicase [Klebsiella pneumoniae]
MADLVYMTEAEKIQAIIEDIKTRTAAGQPVLVGDYLDRKNLKWFPVN